MKKIYSFLFAALLYVGANATSYTISVSGTSYSPNTLTVSIGDVVTIEASASHPLVQVDNTVWTANGTTSLSTGWGETTANHTFTITNTNTIYYVCKNHVSMGMKGQIVVSSTRLNDITSSITEMNIFPVPAKESININYNLKESGKVSVGLYALNGALVAELMNQQQSAGAKQNNLSLPQVSAGAYFLEINFNGARLKQQQIIIK